VPPLSSVSLSGRRGKYPVGRFLYLEGSPFYSGGRLSPGRWALLPRCLPFEVDALAGQLLLGRGGFLGPPNPFYPGLGEPVPVGLIVFFIQPPFMFLLFLMFLSSPCS